MTIPDESPSPRVRLFVAVDPGQAMRALAERAIGRVRRRAPNAKWVGGESLHVTLAFLGYREPALVAEIERALAAVAARHAPMSFQARGAGVFGSSKRPRVLWTALSGDVDALTALQGEVERALVPLGYEPEQRPFKPHLTLARSRTKEGDPGLAAGAEALQDVDFGKTTIDELVLFRSDLSPAGARYTAIARYALNQGS